MYVSISTTPPASVTFIHQYIKILVNWERIPSDIKFSHCNIHFFCFAIYSINVVDPLNRSDAV